MQVYKFGGASVKDAKGVINLTEIVKGRLDGPLLIVVSAMGKTTNALEKLAKAYYIQSEDIQELYEDIKQYHYAIMHELFEQDAAVYDDVANTFVEIDWMLEDEPQDTFDFIYDQLVSVGEFLSTRIVSAYLQQSGVNSQWLDVRSYIHTDNTYREGIVDWEKTRQAVQETLPALLRNKVGVTQGFLGGTSENFTTTLGREGSDYTAAIMATCLQADSVTIWKDVPGVMNADPQLFADTVKFDTLPYSEAMEMTYYGAQVIHPKTIKPLQNAGIPLLVKSFLHPADQGTTITDVTDQEYIKAIIIVKHQQLLLSVTAKDHSFISESHLSLVYALLVQHHLKVNLMQTSALSLSLCLDDPAEKFDVVFNKLQEKFKIKYNRQLTLYTLRHYGESTIREITTDKQVLLEQLSRSTAQLVINEQGS